MLADSLQTSDLRDRAWPKYLAGLYCIFIQFVAAMKWRVRLMRKAGRRIPWKILINEPGLIGTIRTHVCNYGNRGPCFKVAVLTGDSTIAPGNSLLVNTAQSKPMIGSAAATQLDLAYTALAISPTPASVFLFASDDPPPLAIPIIRQEVRLQG